jgi:glycosyl transferase family 25
MKLFVFNLDYAHERRKFITTQLDKLGLDYEIQKCVIGKNLTQEELEREVHMGYMAKSPNWFTPGAIGVTITAKLIYQKIIDQNLPYALVIEDDIVLHKNLPQILIEIEPNIIDGEVILLYYNHTANNSSARLSTQNPTPLKNNYSLYYPVSNHEVTMGCAVIITKGAAEGIIRVNTPIVAIADSWDYFYKTGGIKQIRCIYPTNLSFKKSNLIPKILSLVDKYKVFPFFQLLKQRRKARRKQRESISLVNQPSIFVSNVKQ